MTGRTSFRIVAGALFAVLLAVLWVRLFGDDERPRWVIDRPPPPAQRRSEPVAPATRARVPDEPEVEPAEAEPAPAESRPEEAEVTIDGLTLAEITKEFEDVADYEGKWSVPEFDPFASGLPSLYSYQPAELSAAFDGYVAGFHAKFVAPATRLPDLNPDLEEWPRFSTWLRGAVELHTGIHRKEMTANVALVQDREGTRKLTDAERDRFQQAEHRLRDLRRRLGNEIDERSAAFLKKKD